MRRLTKLVDGEYRENHEYDAKAEEWKQGKRFRNGDKAIIARLAEYEDLEEKGQLIELPCKIGDTVYWIGNFNKNIHQGKVIAFKISRFGVGLEMSQTPDNHLAVKKELEEIFFSVETVTSALKEV